MEGNKKSFEPHNIGKEELSVLNMYWDGINNYDHEKKIINLFLTQRFH